MIRCVRGEFGYVLSDCLSCGSREILGKCGCGDRNCPECGAALREEWAETVASQFIPTRAFHVVFTLPHELNQAILSNKKELLSLIIKAASETLLEFSANSKELSGTPFLLSVLHTWTQDLRFHPHVHCLISSGALQENGDWKEFKGRHLFSVKALATFFRGKVLSEIEELARFGKIELPIHRSDDASLLDYFSKIPNRWVVYCKPPYRGPQVVIRYFARYANRTAISNRRLRSFDGTVVKIACRRDSSEPEPDETSSSSKTIEMTAEDFLTRFLQHIPPKGMHRIRRYGLLSGRISEEKRNHLREIIPTQAEEKKSATQEEPPQPCRSCKSTNTQVLVVRRNPNNPGKNRITVYNKNRPPNIRKENDTS